MTSTGPASALVSPSAVRGVEVSTVTLSPLSACRCASPATCASMPPITGG